VLSVRSFDFRPTDALDGLLTVEFAVEILRESDVLPQIFESAFECPLEHFRLWETGSLCDFSNPIEDFGGHTARVLGTVHNSVSARPMRI
jgi:hypothetical protein